MISMFLKSIYRIVFLDLSLFLGLNMNGETLQLQSSEGRINFEFLKKGNELQDTVNRDGETVILLFHAVLDIHNLVWKMALGKCDMQESDYWMDLIAIDSITYHASVNTSWQHLYGERSMIRKKYNSTTLQEARQDKSKYLIFTTKLDINSMNLLSECLI